MSAPADDQEAALELLKLLGGKWVAAAISAAAQLGIADALEEGPMAEAELAAALSCNQDALGRLLGVLAAEGLLRTDEHDRFQTTVGSLRRRAVFLVALASPQRDGANGGCGLRD